MHRRQVKTKSLKHRSLRTTGVEAEEDQGQQRVSSGRIRGRGKVEASSEPSLAASSSDWSTDAYSRIDDEYTAKKSREAKKLARKGLRVARELQLQREAQQAQAPPPEHPRPQRVPPKPSSPDGFDDLERRLMALHMDGDSSNPWLHPASSAPVPLPSPTPRETKRAKRLEAQHSVLKAQMEDLQLELQTATVQKAQLEQELSQLVITPGMDVTELGLLHQRLLDRANQVFSHMQILLHKKSLKEDHGIYLCKICMDGEVSIMLRPCSHAVLCTACAPKFSECPICRKPIIKRVNFIMG